MADELLRMDVPPSRARSLATLVISALEGAIMLARIRRDTGRLDAVVTELSPLLDSVITTWRGSGRAEPAGAEHRPSLHRPAGGS